ncbi:alpha-L-fucosidase [Bacteroidales bacterium OttesenSCG-928-M11]|nr:alpha-L-fucosidase [Bacteroidales bacterium OttesenSCG-928-M11]
MKKLFFLIVAIFFPLFVTIGQTTIPNHRWFDEARFGMFIHFGPYAVLADGEWIMNQKPYKVDDYMKLQQIFNPSCFDADAWVSLAKAAGMKYIVFTSRHHDGFSNWDTKLSDWNIMNTPYAKDLISQLAEACRKQEMKLGFYYSLLDWSRNDYAYETGRTGKNVGRTVQGNWNDYIEFMKGQLTELLTNYGDVSLIWFDGEWDQMPHNASSHEESAVDWHFSEIYELIHALQPNCMIANNHHLDPLPGEDYQAFERDLPGRNTAGYSEHATVSKLLPLETCQTINGSWGYKLQDNRYKSLTELIHYLISAAGYGSNLLLNVGPESTGRIDSLSSELLCGMGEWLNRFGYTIYGTSGGHIPPQSWGAITRKDQTYYIHILEKESDKLSIFFPGNIISARWVNVEEKLRWSRDEKTGIVTFFLDVPLDEIDSIIELSSNNLIQNIK